MEKIAVVSLAPPSNEGGAEVVWNNLKKDILFDNYYIKEKSGKYKYYNLPNLLHINEILSSPKLWKEINKKKYDVIFYDKIFGWAFKKSNAKKVAYAQGLYTPAGLKFLKQNIFVYLFTKYILSYFEKKSYQNADYVIAVSEGVKLELINIFKINPKKIIVVNNAADHNKFYKLSDENIKKLKNKYNLKENKINILFPPGRNSYGKGYDIIKKIAKKYNTQVNILILSNNKSKIKNIISIPKTPHEKMNEIYNICDFMIFPSRYEGNSLTVLEAAAAKKAIICSKTGLFKTEKEYIARYICNDFEDYLNVINSFIKNKNNIKIAEEKWFKLSLKYPIQKQITEIKSTLFDISKR